MAAGGDRLDDTDCDHSKQTKYEQVRWDQKYSSGLPHSSQIYKRQNRQDS
jgi:hypothetical protein